MPQISNPHQKRKAPRQVDDASTKASRDQSYYSGEMSSLKSRDAKRSRPPVPNPSSTGTAPASETTTGSPPQHPTGTAQNPCAGPWSHKNVVVEKLKAWIDKRVTSLDESSPSVFKYRTPYFRAWARLQIPELEHGESIQVGWIQTCANMHFVNTYGNRGLTSWEFPEIVSGKYALVSDADGKIYPWYGAKKELRTMEGPRDAQTVTIEMNDNFFPQVTWHVPDGSHDRTPRLTHIHRRQKFYTCLAVRDLIHNRFYIFKTITWSMELMIQVEPDKPLGQRARLLGPFEQQAPKLLKKNIKLPVYALRPPNANSCQILVWRPRVGDPRVVVPAIHTTVDMEEYLNMTRYLGDKLAAVSSQS